MIFGADHIAISCERLQPAVEAARAAGWQAVFVEEGLPNSKTKQPLLNRYEPVHDIAYCQPESGVALELTAHSAPLMSGASPYQVLFDGALGDIEPFDGELSCDSSLWNDALGVPAAQAVRWRPFQAQCWSVTCGKIPSTVRGVAVSTADLEGSAQFWMSGFGCRKIARGRNKNRAWIHLAIRAPLAKWSLEIVLFEAAPSMLPFRLDQSGFSCVALLSSDLARDRQRAVDQGAKFASEPSAHQIHGKTLRMVMLRAPSDELVELIEMAPAASSVKTAAQIGARG